MKRKWNIIVSLLFIMNINSFSFGVNTRLPHLIKLAEMSDNVYYTKAKIRNRYKHMKTVQIFSAGKVKVQFMLLLEEKGRKKMQYVAIRGTKNLKNVKIDLMARMVKDKKLGIKLHRGFKVASEAVHKYLIKHLRKNVPVIVTGHSLGGAMALILSLYLKKDGYNVVQTVTFGQPKVFGKKGLKKYKHFPLYRIVNRDDLVARIPPIDPTLKRYFHINKGFMMKTGKGVEHFHKRTKRKLSLKELKKLAKRIKRMKNFSGIKDHSMLKYIANLKKRLQR